MKKATYTGKSGLYSCVFPVKGFTPLLKAITDLLAEDRIELYDISEFHCTIMYSKKDAPHSIRITKFLNSGPFTFKAWSDQVDYWEGHDKAGYLVLKLTSRDLDMRHEQYQDLGCKHSFPEYEAHITLADNVTSKPKNLAKINQMLKSLKFEITLAGENVEDIKD